MTKSNCDEAIRRVLVHEGGYTRHPSDPGGPTNFGITIADYRKYVKPGATAADVKAMTLGEAKTIYRERYWSAVRCDELPDGLDYAIFDYGVNSGPSRAIKVLQRLLGFADDGRISDAVLAAVRKRDAAELIAQLCDERLGFLKRLKTWPVFGSGWGRRVAEVRAAALAMAKARRRDATATAAASPASGKGAVPLNRGAQRGTAGGVVVAGTAAAQQAHQAGVRPAIVVAVLAVTVMLAAAVWWWWRRRLTHQQEC